MGARLTGAGFGGCVVIVCRAEDNERVCGRLRDRYYAKRASFDPQSHLFPAQPSAGALYDTRLAIAARNGNSRDEERILY